MRPAGGGVLGGTAPGDLDMYGHHLTTCAGVRGNTYIAGVHDILVREWERFFTSCGFIVIHEYRVNDPLSEDRIDFWIYDFFGARCGFDVSLACPTAITHLSPARGSSVSPGYAARSREAEKRRKYADIARDQEFTVVPLVMETIGGAWGPTARDVIRRAIRFSHRNRDALNRAGLAYTQLAAYWMRRLSTRLAALVARHTHSMCTRVTSDLRDIPALDDAVASMIVQEAAQADRFGGGFGGPQDAIGDG